MRDNTFAIEKYDAWIVVLRDHLRSVKPILVQPSGNPEYRPQFVYELVGVHLHILLRQYCRGDPVADLKQHLHPLLDAWEEAERLGATVWTPEIQHSRHSWAENISFYNRCFWLVGLAFALELEDVHWQRLVKLIGNEGNDMLLDRVIATRQPGRRIGDALCHPKPYARLLAVLNAPAHQQARLLKDFVTHWYAELDRPPKKGLSRLTNLEDRPYWYDNHEGISSYFGYWCLEAVAVVKAFGVDDALCLGHPHYPGDLLRPKGPSTHPVVSTSEQELTARPESPVPATGWFARMRKMI
jgi:hypothetical protein